MSRVTSSFWGHINEIPHIGVDNFTVYNKRAYFLSHFHADHIEGLFTKRFLENLRQTNAKVYMSEITKIIAEYEYHYNKVKGDLLQYIEPLKIGRTTITLPGDDENDDEYLQVKLIPAGHSLGSVMYLYNYKDKTILFTGDFRMKPDNLPAYGQFHENNGPINIDVIYLDTTFQDIDHNVFPSRKESVDRIIGLIRGWLKTDGNRIALFAHTKYVYEFVFNEIYKQLGIRVYVDDFKWNLYRQLPDQIKGVTNNNKENLIHICPKATDYHGHCVPNSTPGNYLKIYLSAYKWLRRHEESAYSEEHEEGDHSVCFSTHCSRSELIYFVNYFSPKTVIGFRKPYYGNMDAEYEVEQIEISQPTPKKVRRDVKLVKKSRTDLLRKF